MFRNGGRLHGLLHRKKLQSNAEKKAFCFCDYILYYLFQPIGSFSFVRDFQVDDHFLHIVCCDLCVDSVVIVWKDENGQEKDVNPNELDAHLEDLEALYKIIDQTAAGSGIHDKIDVLISRYKYRIEHKTKKDDFIIKALITPLYGAGGASVIALFTSLAEGKISITNFEQVSFVFTLIAVICAMITICMKCFSFKMTNWETMVTDLEDIKVFVLKENESIPK